MSHPAMDFFRPYTSRIDNATLRERVMLFAAAALVLIGCVNYVLIDPLRATQKRLGAQINQREGELRTVQGELQRIAREFDSDPDAINRKRVSALQAEVADLDVKIKAEQNRFTPPDRMRRVLEEMLERNKGLHLVGMKTLPIGDMTASQGQAARHVFRHGVELTLAGSYLDLHAYLRALEGLSTQLYWGKAEMLVTAYPVATLKLTVYTLSFDQAWLVV
jgi:MSHA biogenesis protein MshJ